MADEQSHNELTTTLHLGVREASNSPVNFLEEHLSLLSAQDREVVSEILASQGEKAIILITRGSHKGSRFLVTKDVVTIGRSVDSDIFLDDVTVSRNHATVLKSDSGFVLNDAGSLNGTYVNNVSVNEHSLVSGEEFQIGKFHLLFIGSTSKDVLSSKKLGE